MNSELIFNEDDLPYEEEILRNPYSVKHWMRYIEFKKDAPKQVINMIYERALRELPGSYKLWYNYLKLRRKQVKGYCIIDPEYEDVNNTFERALVFMHKMIRIWLDYCQFLIDQRKITRTRHVFDRSLEALPITQHHRIWPLYLKFVCMYNIPQTAVRVYHRYLKLYPENAEEFIDYLISVGWLDDAAVELEKIVNKEDFVSRDGKSKYQLWNELCNLISKNPDKVRSLKVDAIIRGGLRRYTDQLGQLWNSLADYYTRSGLFERARDVYEEAIQTVMTVRDFTQVFDACAQFEESLISAKMQETAKLGPTEEDDLDLDLRLARLEDLMDRRPLLLNSVLLRQNPHNVHDWHKRVKLFEGKPREVINFEGALSLMQRATAAPPRKVAYHDQSEPVQFRLYKSLKIWSMYADLEESFGTFKSSKAVYDRIIDLKIATPQIIINYGLFLEENNYFEEAFKAYEKGIALFKWPNVYDIWNTYLIKFLKRYKGTKLERARDLFEQCLEGCPAKFAKSLYLLYVKLEEEHGLARHAMTIYDRATRAVPPEDQFEMFNIYIKKAAEIYGVTYTRQIYEKAIEALPDSQAREMCLRFADLERKLGEIDRARAIYAHCSQMCDPRTTSEFWQTWKEFEIRHGNEDTMREMLRMKRSVQATYNTQVHFMSSQMLTAAVAAAGGTPEIPTALQDKMKLLEAKAQALAEEAQKDVPKMPGRKDILFVRGGTTATEEELAELSKTTNPDEIAIDDDFESDDDEKVEEIEVEQRTVPTEVFGELKR
ncbi:pre-mRNA-splicing factor SYF1-like [Centruroides sculpturatus]|uniref:pre-mRNA-splicing factor SYF1-like n=1 Tax=Centruroides sculpturatus TaxID=218467 RepID=UPI000C6DA6C0|nr:pre-mRNA-splicing factor SYF1-like [Centruroides sculpturatus]